MTKLSDKVHDLSSRDFERQRRYDGYGRYHSVLHYKAA